MLRRLFTLMSAASLVLCVATSVLWVRSYWLSDQYVVHPSTSRQFQVESRYGTIWLRTGSLTYSPTPIAFGYHGPSGYVCVPVEDNDRAVGTAGLGFLYRSETASYGTFRAAAVPHWFACAMLAVASAPAVWRVRVRRQSRAAGLLCLACGYDLRATPARCPECGAVPART